MGVDRMKSSPRPNSQRGVSLLEVLVAIVIVSVGVLGLVGLQARATQLSVGAEDRNRAAMLVDEVAAQMWLLNRVDLPNAQVQDFQELAASAVPNGELAIAASSAIASARITIRWKAPSAAASAASSVYFSDVVIR